MKEGLLDKIYEISNKDEADVFKDYLFNLYISNTILRDEYAALLNELDEHCGSMNFITPTIDDYDWELMKESDPNLSDQ